MTGPVQSVSRTERISAKVENGLTLIDLKLTSISAVLLNPVPHRPINIQLSVATSFIQRPSLITIDIVYDLRASDADARDALKAKPTFSLYLTRKSEDVILDPDDLRAFGAIGAVRLAHPYFRELVQSLTAKMGMPPLVLDILPPSQAV